MSGWFLVFEAWVIWHSHLIWFKYILSNTPTIHLFKLIQINSKSPLCPTLSLNTRSHQHNSVIISSSSCCSTWMKSTRLWQQQKHHKLHLGLFISNVSIRWQHHLVSKINKEFFFGFSLRYSNCLPNSLIA